MTILINAYQYAHGVTGTDRMAHNFLDELQKIDSVNNYLVVCSTENYIPNVLSAPNFQIISPPAISHPFIRRAIHKFWRIFLPLLLWSKKADVYFSFHNMRLPSVRIAKKMFASNLDLIPLLLDDYKSQDSKLIKEIYHTAANADKFMSISHFSKDELCRTLNVSPERVTVIHLAADASFSGSNALPLPNQVIKPYIFTIGGSEPRKNVITVARAFDKLEPTVKSAYSLVIAGGAWHGRSLDQLKLNERIQVLGQVSDSELMALYRSAALFVFASEYEGFGFTVLEAMTSKVPVISSNSSSLVEVADDAAILFDAKDASSLSEKMTEVLADKNLRKSLVERGVAQAERFSWKESAEKLHAFLTS